jgi:hypothetical protein
MNRLPLDKGSTQLPPRSADEVTVHQLKQLCTVETCITSIVRWVVKKFPESGTAL